VAGRQGEAGRAAAGRMGATQAHLARGLGGQAEVARHALEAPPGLPLLLHHAWGVAAFVVGGICCWGCTRGGLASAQAAMPGSMQEPAGSTTVRGSTTVPVLLRQYDSTTAVATAVRTRLLIAAEGVHNSCESLARRKFIAVSSLFMQQRDWWRAQPRQSVTCERPVEVASSGVAC
jgi:hypothetical protein